MINRLYMFPIAVIVAIIDQLSKYEVSGKLLLGEKFVINPSYLSFMKAYNTGAAFSILENKTHILAMFSLIVTIGISVYFIKKVHLMPIILIIGWGLILGGTIGNMIDRISLGYVIDFIKLEFINFPIFNIADLSINLGAFLIFIHIFTKSLFHTYQKE